MGKKTKTYRGQRKSKMHIGCGCFYCTGYDKQGVIDIKEKIIDKETDKIINNFDLYRVSIPKGTFCDLYQKECMGVFCSVIPFHEKCEHKREQNEC